MTLLQLKRDIGELLGTETAEYLIEDVLNMSRMEMLMKQQENVEQALAEAIMRQAQRVKDGEPLQYVTGRAFFCDMVLRVDRNVLIPRPETAQLVRKVADAVGEGQKRVLDIGTGSGAIALGIKSMCPKAQVTAIDVSEGALNVAERNAEEQGLEVDFRQCDILSDEAVERALGGKKFDIIVSNPPYVLESEKADMEGHVLNYEPHLALFVADHEPLLFYERIADLAAGGVLDEGGELYFEINERYGKETAEMMMQRGFERCRVYKDAYEKDRFVSGTPKSGKKVR